MNCELNGVYLDTSSDDVIGSKIGDWDVVFLGDCSMTRISRTYSTNGSPGCHGAV